MLQAGKLTLQRLELKLARSERFLPFKLLALLEASFAEALPPPLAARTFRTPASAAEASSADALPPLLVARTFSTPAVIRGLDFVLALDGAFVDGPCVAFTQVGFIGEVGTMNGGSPRPLTSPSSSSLLPSEA